jgi:hypothetical protein
MLLKGARCHVSQSVNSDARPRPTAHREAEGLGSADSVEAMQRELGEHG